MSEHYTVQFNTAGHMEGDDVLTGEAFQSILASALLSLMFCICELKPLYALKIYFTHDSYP